MANHPGHRISIALRFIQDLISRRVFPRQYPPQNSTSDSPSNILSDTLSSLLNSPHIPFVPPITFLPFTTSNLPLTSNVPIPSDLPIPTILSIPSDLPTTSILPTLPTGSDTTSAVDVYTTSAILNPEPTAQPSAILNDPGPIIPSNAVPIQPSPITNDPGPVKTQTLPKPFDPGPQSHTPASLTEITKPPPTTIVDALPTTNMAQPTTKVLPGVQDSTTTPVNILTLEPTSVTSSPKSAPNVVNLGWMPVSSTVLGSLTSVALTAGSLTFTYSSDGILVTSTLIIPPPIGTEPPMTPGASGSTGSGPAADASHSGKQIAAIVGSIIGSLSIVIICLILFRIRNKRRHSHENFHIIEEPTPFSPTRIGRVSDNDNESSIGYRDSPSPLAMSSLAYGHDSMRDSARLEFTSTSFSPWSRRSPSFSQNLEPVTPVSSHDWQMNPFWDPSEGVDTTVMMESPGRAESTTSNLGLMEFADTRSLTSTPESALVFAQPFSHRTSICSLIDEPTLPDRHLNLRPAEFYVPHHPSNKGEARRLDHAWSRRSLSLRVKGPSVEAMVIAAQESTKAIVQKTREP